MDDYTESLSIVPSKSLSLLPALVTVSGDRAGIRFLEFFAANIRNPHTRRAYGRAVGEFLAWCGSVGVASLAAVQPLRVASWIESQGREVSAPTVKQQLAALRHLFDWLVTGQVVPVNPAASVRGPSHVVRSGKTAVLEPEEARRLLNIIDAATTAGLRDRALISLMVYSFARSSLPILTCCATLAASPWPTRARIRGSFRTILDTGTFSTPSSTRPGLKGSGGERLKIST
jgi:hypothetical protein